MKKILFLLILIPFCVFAEEKVSVVDKVEIETVNSKVFYGEKEIKYSNSINTRIIYGDEPTTYVIGFTIPFEYKLYKKNKGDIIYKSNYKGLYIDTDSEYTYNYDDNKLLIIVGDYRGIFKEKENINITYSLEFDSTIEERTSMPIYMAEYDTKELNFTIYLSEKDKDKQVLFSLDNKNFKKELEGLKTTYNEERFIDGTYSKKILKDQTLYFMIVDSNDIFNLENISIYLYIFIAIVVLTSILVIRKRLTKKKKSVL